MAKQLYYYQFDVNSKAGRALTKFWRKVITADTRADNYGKKYGAAYIEQPVQFFGGGVDYVVFSGKVPDERVWRKKFMDKEGNFVCEPNCMYRTDVLALPDDRFHPSNTWNVTYAKKHLSWPEVRPMKTFQQWAALSKMKLTDDREADVKRLDERMSRYTFVTFLEFYGDGSVPTKHMDKRKCPAWLRRAIKAEQDRQSLPVVEVYPLFTLLGVEPESKNGTVNFSQTPNFFVYGETYYVCSEYPCKAEGMHPITEGVYIYKRNVANQEAAHES